MSIGYKQNGDVILRHEDEGALAFDQSTGRICVMNQTAAFIWEHCTGDFSAGDIAILLRQHFDLSEVNVTDSSLLESIKCHLELLYKSKLVDLIEVGDAELQSLPSGRGGE